MTLILPFTSPAADLAAAGGKGANLARLTRAGFPVPPGYILTTAAYQQFVAQHGLQPVIQAALAECTTADPVALERASATIRAAFRASAMPAEIATALRAASLQPEAAVPLAVRSSATAEDLPDLSFAGQQDTFLNVIRDEQLLAAVVECWSSLWTARAIGYRDRSGISHAEAALAVVVQALVPSEVAGVLFTANPLTGLRSETVIDAVFGLGEALVSGQVEPDHYVVDSFTGAIRSQALGSKQVATRSRTGGGVETVRQTEGQPGAGASPADGRQTLGAAEIRQLVDLGRQVQAEYRPLGTAGPPPSPAPGTAGAPQDIEWAFAGGQLYLLQARPITSLFPLPKGASGESGVRSGEVGEPLYPAPPLIIWFSFGAVQGLMGPITPLGRDTIRQVYAGFGRMFGVQLDPANSDGMVEAGERLWIKISDVLRHPLGSRIYSRLLGFIEPSVGRLLEALSAEPGLSPGQGKLKLSTLLRLVRFFGPVFCRLVLNMLCPARARAAFDASLETTLAEAERELARLGVFAGDSVGAGDGVGKRPVYTTGGGDRFFRLAGITAFIRRRVAQALPFVLPRFIPIFGPSMAALNLLFEIAGADRSLALEVTRGLPRNVTTEMDLALWHTAAAIQADAEAAAALRALPAAALAQHYLNGVLPAAAQSAIAGFMERYGMRGLGEIDLGQPRWREDPTPLLHTLQSYLDIPPQASPAVVFERGAQAAQAAADQLAARARRQPGGWLKEKLARAAVRRVRLLMGARESPKFFAIRVMGLSRRALLAAGAEFAAAGELADPTDLVFLTLDELDALARRTPRDWKILCAERRAAYRREERRRQAPRVLVSDGRAFYEGLGAGTGGPAATPAAPAGTPAGPAGTSAGPAGTSAAPAGTPAGLTGTSADPAGTPADPAGTPADLILSGSPVSPGVVEGIVHVVLDPRAARLASGEILVCPGTDPAWTPLFMMASGLITEVGGMMTHGSVVAREYGIPAVVGVHLATERLQDGQRIRLDGTRGEIVVLS